MTNSDSLVTADFDRLLHEIDTEVEQVLSKAVEIRRYLHRHPELSEEEYGTTEYLASLLQNLDLHPYVCQTRRGLWCDLVSPTNDHPSTSDPSTNAPLQRLVIRGDIDALPIADAKSVDYRSSRAGVMHACGHDAHPATVYSALSVLRTLMERNLLPWPIAIRGLFQPAEETATGAAAMIREHALRDVSAAMTLHVDPTRSVGRIGIRAGTLTASCDTFRVEFIGRGGHGARPHLTRDPIEAAATWITTAYRRVTRTIDVHRPVIISVGKIHGGHASNVIPDNAALEGTVRALTRDTRAAALEALEDINNSVASQFGIEVRLTLTESAPPVVNDSGMAQMIAEAADLMLGPGCVDWIPDPSMGSEDFSYYLDHVPGVMFRLGVAGDQVGHAPLHTPLFDIDERSLAVGIRMMVCAAILYFRPTSHP